MQIFLFACLLSYGFYNLDDRTANVQDLLKSAARKDQAAFATDYLHAAFSAWQNRFRLESFRVDSVFAKGEYEEIWLNQASSQHRLALLVSLPPARKIIEARRLLLAEREKLQPIENEVVEFAERLAWIYETGEESFMQDFLYPSYVKLRYAGLTGPNEILPRLRAKFKEVLPIQSLGWEGRRYTYAIRLVLDSPLQPLEISVDIQKHLTANFFELIDKSERVQALKDSLRLWATSQRANTAGKNLTITASTPAEAIAKVLAQHFEGYDLAMLDSTAKGATIEATLPVIEQIRPARLRFRLEVSRAGAGKYAVRPIWFAAGETRDGSAANKNSKQKTAASGRDDRLDIAANETVQRYGTLDLPPAFQPELDGSRNAIGSLTLYHRQADSVQWRGALALQNILHGLTRDKRAYFFLQSSSKNAGNATVSGYAIWRDTQRLWQHLARINETYSLVNSRYQLRHVKIDLYPFIRLENVRALFAEPDTSARRGKIVIIR